MGNLRTKKGKSGANLSAPTSSQLSTDGDYLAFSFKHNMNREQYSLSENGDDHGIAVMERIIHFSQMTWTQIKLQAKNKSGCEKIPKDLIKKAHPDVVTEEIKEFFVLRCKAQDTRLIGIRLQRVFEVIWYDPDRSLYDHD